MRTSRSLLLAIALIAAGCSDRGLPTAPRVPSLKPDAEKTAGKPAPTTIPVTTTLYDRDAGGNLLLTRSDDYNGPGLATYTEVNRMTSHIGATGAWMMYIGNQSVRTVYLVLGSQGIPAPDGYYYQNVEIYSQCFDSADNQIGILSMGAGESNGNCSFGMDFTSGRTKYKLTMVPTSPGTGRAIVTCNAVTGGSCSDWTIVPNAVAPNAGVAYLYHFSNNGGLIFDGVYHNSYSVRLTR